MDKFGKLVNGEIQYAPLRNGGLVTDNGIVFAPSKSIYNANGYYKVVIVEEDGTDEVVDGNLLHYIGAPITTEYKPTYEERVVELIRNKYTLDEELALLRQRDTKADEFSEYNAYCEQCKAQAKEELL